MSNDGLNSLHDSTEVVGECDECGDDVTRADRVKAQSYPAEFCSRACLHAWKSQLGRRIA